MKDLHIPYGLDRITNEIIEPEDAVRGRACNCLCPGCSAPLLSRHPKSDDKRIHFAHDSKHPDAKPIEDCPLSPYVALGMMFRHLAETLNGKPILLNSYCKQINFECCSATSKSVFVTEGSEAFITHCEPSPVIGGVTYDLMLQLSDGKSYFVELIYPGKNKKDLPAAHHLSTAGGIFCVSGPEFLEMMTKDEFKTARYSECVAQFLLTNSRKFWAYHFLESDAEASIRAKHFCKPSYGMSAYSRQRRQHHQPSARVYSGSNYNTTANGYSQYRTPTQTINDAAEAYRKASKGEGGTPGYSSLNPKSAPRYNIQEKHYLLPPSYHNRHDQVPNETELNDPYIESYKCLFCDVEFTAPQGNAPKCPKCNGHLGAQRQLR